jgi:hypothetical protein
VIKDPDIRREVSQLQSCEGSGREEVGTEKVCFAAPQEQDTVSSLDVMPRLDSSV